MNKKEFRKLKSEWYAKLEESGFHDLEKDEYTLKRPLSKIIKEMKGKIKSGTWKAQEEYYIMAARFLNIYEFKSNTQMIIWEYHANGMSVRNIADTLRKANILSTSHRTVWKVIRDLRKVMPYVLSMEDDDAIEQ